MWGVKKLENKKYEQAILAGGCFWCMVKPFEKWSGVQEVVSGYTGGTKPNPTYEEVCSETTGHYEAVRITFDPEVIRYEEILNIYWQQIDPTGIPVVNFLIEVNLIKPQFFI